MRKNGVSETYVDLDTYAILPGTTLFCEVVRTALIKLGYTTAEAMGAKGTVPIVLHGGGGVFEWFEKEEIGGSWKHDICLVCMDDRRGRVDFYKVDFYKDVHFYLRSEM